MVFAQLVRERGCVLVRYVQRSELVEGPARGPGQAVGLMVLWLVS